MPKNFEHIRNILFIRFGAIGDVVHTTAAYQTLRQNIKNVNIDYLTSSVMQELLNNDPMLRQVISADDNTYDGLFRLSQKLSAENYDLIVNLQPSLKTYFFNLVMNKHDTLTYKKFKPNKEQQHIHAVQNFFNTITPLIPDIEPPKNLKIYLNPEIVKWAKYRLDSERVTHAIGIIPGVSGVKRGRLWPKEYWKQLLDYITNSKRINVIIFGGTNEFELANELQNVNQNRINNMCGKLSISQTAGILSLCMLVVGCDTGPTHIATAVGPKVIGLYGLTSPLRTGLYGIGHTIIHSNHDCLFCEKKICSQTDESNAYVPCMTKLSVDTVISKLGI